MKTEQTPLGIIAGNGALPRALIQTCLNAKRPVFVLVLKGSADPTLLDDVPGAIVRPETIGRSIRLLKKNHVRDVVFIGGVRRPSLAEIRPDWKALTMLVRVWFKLLGDDNLLKIILSEAEHNGFNVVGIDTLMPQLLATEGVYGRCRPNKKDWEDIKRGTEVAKLLGQADVGQAVIVQRGLVLSVEGIEGTAELIKRTAALKRKGDGGVLVKVAKPQQDRRVDLPTVGVRTVQAVYDAGLKGIAIETKGALLAEAEAMIDLADRLGIFVVGVACQN